MQGHRHVGPGMGLEWEGSNKARYTCMGKAGGNNESSVGEGYTHCLKGGRAQAASQQRARHYRHGQKVNHNLMP